MEDIPNGEERATVPATAAGERGRHPGEVVGDNDLGAVSVVAAVAAT